MTPCPLCGSAPPSPFVVRADVPVHQNLPAPTRAEARAAPRGRIEMVACAACGFVFNGAFDPALPRYGPGYDNAQSHSPAFAAHLDALARHLVEERGVRDARIVEVGCGQGDFLRRLVEWPGSGNRAVGFDPAYQGPDAACDGRLRFERRFYGPDCAHAPADVVVCRHVIEHIADPLALLRAVRAALANAPAARVFFETPDVDWILRHAVLWDFFYEHCSLFSAAALMGAFTRAEFVTTEVLRVFGDQYLWLEAMPGSGCAGTPPPGETATLAARYGKTEAARLKTWRNRLEMLAADGPVALWGAGAKGVTLAGLADPDAVLIDCVADINPGKQGRFVPATGHPIVPPSALPARGVRSVVLVNPVYRQEVAALLPACGNPRLAEWND
jgi:SAM-dependent methyltransferase